MFAIKVYFCCLVCLDYCEFFLKSTWTASDLIPQAEVEAIQLDEGRGLDGGLLFELLLPALR